MKAPDNKRIAEAGDYLAAEILLSGRNVSREYTASMISASRWLSEKNP